MPSKDPREADVTLPHAFVIDGADFAEMEGEQFELDLVVVDRLNAGK
jgi:hypothetical protein